MYGIIYKITNLINNKIYVGQTTQPLNRRFKQHINNALRASYQLNKIHLYAAIRHYGAENFCIEQIDSADTRQELNQKEIYWINELQALDNNIGYNCAYGGQGNVAYEQLLLGAAKRAGRKMAEETKQKISAANKGKPKSDLHRKHLSENHHLKTIHILIYKDGNISPTMESIDSLAKSLNVTATALKRASLVGEFRCGDFYLLDLEDPKIAFGRKYRYSKECIVVDPITKKLTTPCKLRISIGRSADYSQFKHTSVYDYFIEEIKTKMLYYIKKHNILLKEALQICA